jgi:hypothetical protein
VFEPTANVTVPVAVEGLTVAVRVVVSVLLSLVFEALSEIVGAAVPTTSVKLACFVSPPEVTSIVIVPLKVALGGPVSCPLELRDRPRGSDVFRLGA